MGTEILRPQDCLVERFRVSPAGFYRRRNFSGYGNLITNTKQQHGGGHHKKVVTRPEKVEQKKKFNNKGICKKSFSSEDLKSRQAASAAAPGGGSTGLVMGKVTILRRGESVDSLTKLKNNAKLQQKQTPADDLTICETPAMTPTKIRPAPPPAAVDMYAGSAFSMSPSPRALPLPSFFNNNKKSEDDYAKLFEDSATRDLRRLLRIE